ncbi:hypothetical protein HYS48_02335 [Candidatus Woesearchaeota archaeon]|nr:hypothetical protein [Candidatus Woesearchaeota archaeon]
MPLREVSRLRVALVLFLAVIVTFIVTLNVLQNPRFTQRNVETVYIDFGPQSTEASIRIITPPEKIEATGNATEVQQGG